MQQVSIELNDLESARVLFKAAESLGLRPQVRVHGFEATPPDGDSFYVRALTVIGFRGERVRVKVDGEDLWCTLEPVDYDRVGVWVLMDPMQ